MATYDVLSIYPEGKSCDACGKKIKNSFFITITGRTVCSFICKNNLKPKPEDSCSICGKPVWEGYCYATRTKFFCCDKCKDSFLKQRNSLKGTNAKPKDQTYQRRSSFSISDENLVFLKIKYGMPFAAKDLNPQRRK